MNTKAASSSPTTEVMPGARCKTCEQPVIRSVGIGMLSKGTAVQILYCSNKLCTNHHGNTWKEGETLPAFLDVSRTAIAISREAEARYAELYRKMMVEVKGLMEDGDISHTTSICAMYLASRAHAINADKAQFKLEGITDADGKALGDWEVTIKLLAKPALKKAKAKTMPTVDKKTKRASAPSAFIEQMDMLYADFSKYSDGDAAVPFVVLRESLISALNEYDACRETLIAKGA